MQLYEEKNLPKKMKKSKAKYGIPAAKVWQIAFLTAQVVGMLIYRQKEGKCTHILIAAEWQYAIKNRMTEQGDQFWIYPENVQSYV